MGIKTVAQKGVEVIFKVAADAVKDGVYTVKTDDGFGNKTEAFYDVRVIKDTFTKEDVETSPFSELIQHTDVKGLVPGVDLDVLIKTSNKFKIEDDEYKIVAYSTDPLEVLHTLLLRNIK